MKALQCAFQSLFFVGGILIPGYKSFKSIESDDIQSHQRWISYWIIWSLISLASLFEGLWMKCGGKSCTSGLFYLVGKALLIGWCASDSFKGSLTLYNSVLRPVLIAWEQPIDEAIEKLRVRARELIDAVLVRGRAVSNAQIQKALAKVHISKRE